MSESRADVVKLAWRARSVRDNVEAFELLRDAAKPTITLCMGEEGPGQPDFVQRSSTPSSASPA